MADSHFEPKELLHCILEMEHRLLYLESTLEANATIQNRKQTDALSVGGRSKIDLGKEEKIIIENFQTVETLLSAVQKAKTSVLDNNNLNEYYHDSRLHEIYSLSPQNLYTNKRDLRIVIIAVVFMLYILFSLFMMIR